MTKTFKRPGRLMGVILLGLALTLPWLRAEAAHDVRGITGPTFNLYAFPFNINLPEGTSLYMWGFGDLDAGSGATHPDLGNASSYNLPQYPGPTLVVNQGETVTINLTNFGVPQPVSIVVPGHNVTATGGSEGLVTQAASAGQNVTYTFVADKPGTYLVSDLLDRTTVFNLSGSDNEIDLTGENFYYQNPLVARRRVRSAWTRSVISVATATKSVTSP